MLYPKSAGGPSRVAARYLAGGADPSEGAAEEAMGLRIDGATVREHIRRAMSDFILAAQKTHAVVERAVKTVEAPKYLGAKVSRDALERLALEDVQSVWGEGDPGSKLFAAMFARGRYIY